MFSKILEKFTGPLYIMWNLWKNVQYIWKISYVVAFQKLALLHFRSLFNLLILLGILNLAKSHWLILELRGQTFEFKLKVCSPF